MNSVSAVLLCGVLALAATVAEAQNPMRIRGTISSVDGDLLMVKTREAGAAANRAIYLAIGVNTDGIKEVLGLWTAPTEGAKFWLSVVTELKNRGVNDILIACVDGLKGLPEAIAAVYPHAEVQLCLVHLVRHSLTYVSWKQRKAVAADLRAVYTSATVDEAGAALDAFALTWDATYPQIAYFAQRDRSFRAIVTDGGLLHGF